MNEMREQFEKLYPVPKGMAWSADTQGYVCDWTEVVQIERFVAYVNLWTCWKQSREALSVVLPCYDAIVMDRPLEMRGGIADGPIMSQVYQSLHRQCRAAIEAQGLKVKP